MLQMNFIEVSRKALSLLDGGREKTGVGEGYEAEGVSMLGPRILHEGQRGGHGGMAVGVGGGLRWERRMGIVQ